MDIVLSIILLIAALALIAVVLLQSSKKHGLSGTIAGSAETFFGKTKGKSKDKMLSRITTILSAVFVVLVLAVYITQDNNELIDLNKGSASAETTTAVTTTASTPAATTPATTTPGTTASTDAPSTDAVTK